MTENMLKCTSILIKKSYFQDLPFLWLQNPQHAMFLLPFFTQYKEAWTLEDSAGILHLHGGDPLAAYAGEESCWVSGVCSHTETD